MSRLVVRRVFLLFVADDEALALHAHHHLILRQFEIPLRDNLAVLPRGHQRRLVHKVGQIRAREAWCSASNYGKVDVVG
jgi:hypothetical protein